MSELEELRALVETQKEEIKKLSRIATDHRYMKEAYREMLGPIGLEVAKAWDKRGVTRQHTSWGPDAFTTLDGEGRAKVLLDTYNAIEEKRLEIVDDSEGEW